MSSLPGNLFITDGLIAEILEHAEALDDGRVCELNAFADRVKNGEPPARPEYDDDPVLPLLKACVPLSLPDQKRLHRVLGQVIAAEERKLA